MHKDNHFEPAAAGEERYDETGPVVLVSTIAPQAGRTIELLYGEVAAMYRCGGPDTDTDTSTSAGGGILATCVYHSLCGQAVMLMQTFDSMRHYREWSSSSDGRFARERLRSMAERVDQTFYRLFCRD